MTPAEIRHRCFDPDKTDDLCLNGLRYTYCESEYCGGACQDVGRCPCECHGEGRVLVPEGTE